MKVRLPAFKTLDRSTLSEKSGKFKSEPESCGFRESSLVMVWVSGQALQKKCGGLTGDESPMFPAEKAGSPELPGWISAGGRLRHIIGIAMRPRFQIILSNRQIPGTPVQPSGFWSRVKRFSAGAVLATMAIAVLIDRKSVV